MRLGDARRSRRGWTVGVGVSALAIATVFGAMVARGSPPPGRAIDAKPAGVSALPAAPARGPQAGTAAGVAPDVVGKATSTVPAAGPRPAPATGQGSDDDARRGPLLLWPFTSAAQVRQWEVGYREGGHQPWHASPCETTLSFVRFTLAYSDVTDVARCDVRGTQAWVSVGYSYERGRVNAAGATIHLVRIGSHPGGWVVVGSRDRASLTLTHPRYGAEVARLVHLSGEVAGLGEDLLRVRILDRSGHSLGEAPRRLIGLGGSWSADIRLLPSKDPVLMAVASTDSGLGSLGDLALTALVQDDRR
jgi:hypothetical protein